MRGDVVERRPVLLDHVGQRDQQSSRLGVERRGELIDGLRHMRQLVDGVGEPRRRLAFENVTRGGGRRGRGAEREGHEALAAERPEVEPGDRVAPNGQVAVDGHRHAHVVALEPEVLDAARAQPGEADVGAAVEPLDVAEVGVQLVSPVEETQAEGQLDRDRQQDEADEEEEADALLAAHDALRDRPRAASRAPGP